MLGETRDTILECNEAPYQSAVKENSLISKYHPNILG